MYRDRKFTSWWGLWIILACIWCMLHIMYFSVSGGGFSMLLHIAQWTLLSIRDLCGRWWIQTIGSSALRNNLLTTFRHHISNSDTTSLILNTTSPIQTPHLRFRHHIFNSYTTSLILNTTSPIKTPHLRFRHYISDSDTTSSIYTPHLQFRNHISNLDTTSPT